MEEEMVKCILCEKIVPERTTDRDGQCSFCRALEKATDMGVGDINTK